MWSLVVALLASGCSSPTPTPQQPPAAGARAGKAKMKGKAGAGKAKRPMGGGGAALGVAGPVTGELKLTVLDGDAPAAPAPTDPAPTEPAPAEEAPEAAPTPAEPAEGAAPAPVVTVPHTQADLLMTFSDGQTVPVTLGKVTGTCAEVPIKPIGPETNPQTPLWSVQCTDAITTSDLAILQLADQVVVLRAMPTPTGELQYRPVKRIKLAQGATLQRKAG
ncbi:MAG: hypothetical protein R3F59_22965 [Myxococcota bacterium]